MNNKQKMSILLATASVISVGFGGAFSSFAAYTEGRANSEIQNKIPDAGANLIERIRTATGLTYDQMLEKIDATTGKIDINSLTQTQKDRIKEILRDASYSYESDGNGFYSLRKNDGSRTYNATELANWLKEGKNYVEPSSDSGSGDSGFVTGGGSSSSGSASSTEAQSTPATDVKVAKEYAFPAAQKEQISAEKTIESVVSAGTKLSNITPQNNAAVVFKTQDGNTNLAIWTFELGKLNQKFAKAYDKVQELKAKTGTLTTTEKVELAQAEKELSNYNFKLKVNSGKAESSNVLSTSAQTALKGKNALVVDFSENGTYPGESVVDLNMGKDCANKKYMVFFVKADKNGKKDVKCLTTDLTVNGSGYARFRSSYGATYVFVPNTSDNVAAKDTLAQNISQ